MKHGIAILACVFAAQAAYAESVFNPFTGVAVEKEQLKRQVDVQREMNNLSKEKLESARIDFQLKNVDKIMRAEMNKMLSSAAPVSMPGEPLTQVIPPRQTKQGKPKVLKMDHPAETAPGFSPAPPVPSQPRLVMVLDDGRSRIAVIEHIGQTHNVRTGDATPLGQVSSIENDSVVIGGNRLSIDKMVVAVNNPDIQDVGSMGGGKSPSGIAMRGMPQQGMLPPPPAGGIPPARFN